MLLPLSASCRLYHSRESRPVSCLHHVLFHDISQLTLHPACSTFLRAILHQPTRSTLHLLSSSPILPKRLRWPSAQKSVSYHIAIHFAVLDDDTKFLTSICPNTCVSTTQHSESTTIHSSANHSLAKAKVDTHYFPVTLSVSSPPSHEWLQRSEGVGRKQSAQTLTQRRVTSSHSPQTTSSAN